MAGRARQMCVRGTTLVLLVALSLRSCSAGRGTGLKRAKRCIVDLDQSNSFMNYRWARWKQRTRESREHRWQPRYRIVRLGMDDILWPFATHWAVQVDDTWFEVQGASKQDSSSPTIISMSSGHRSAVNGGADVGRFGRVGHTYKSDSEIVRFLRTWCTANPVYSFDTHNCQKFARDFIEWLTDGTNKPLPMMDAGVGGNRIRGPTAWCGADAGATYAGAMVAIMQGHSRRLMNGALVALRVSCACLFQSPHGVGVFAEAELGRAEVGIGPLRFALHLNINTGIGFRNRDLEASLLGFGIHVGHNGVSLSWPWCTVGLGRQMCTV